MSGHVKHQKEARAIAVLSEALGKFSDQDGEPTLPARTGEVRRLIEAALALDRADRDALPGSAVKKIKHAREVLADDSTQAGKLLREAKTILSKRRNDA